MATTPNIYIPPRGESRRGLLSKGLFGGALLLLGGGGALFARGGKSVALPPEGLLVLDARQYATIAAIADRLLPAAPDFPSAEALRIAFKFDRVISTHEPSAQGELKQLLGLFENALPNFLFGQRLTPFSMMDAAAQDAVLHEWQTSSLALRRTGYNALRGLLLATYYGSKETWASVGYPGPPPVNDPNAPVWKGGGAPRPPGNGSWTEEGGL
jgi:Gluconate 2-dehydrogenase subunit 3